MQMTRLCPYAPTLLLLLACLLTGCGDDRGHGAGQAVATNADAATQHIRSLYFAQDNFAGAAEGRTLRETFPESVELAAWHILNVARSGEADLAVADAQELLDRHPENAWSRFALAGAMIWHRDSSKEDALSASAAAFEANPAHDDFLWLRAESLRLRGSKQRAVSLLEGHPARLKESPELMNVRAGALFDMALADPSNDARREAALEAYARSRKAAPANVNAWFEPGWFLLASDRPVEAHPLLQRAADLSSAGRVQRSYWAAIIRRDDLTEAEKRDELDRSISRLLDSPGVAPALLPVAAAAYGEVGLEAKEKAIEARVLQQYPESRHAEAVLMNRIFEMERQDHADESEYIESLQAFLARNPIPEPLNRHNAQRMLFDAIRDDPDADPAALRDVVFAMSGEEGVVVKVLAHTQGVMALASRKAFLSDAERLAEAGLAMVPDLVERPPEAAGAPVAGENQGSGIEAAMRGALGWVYFNQGRIEEARRELLASYRMEARLASTLLHLGTLYESEKDFEAAETWYIRCAALPTGDDHPCANVLGDYYVRREGSTAGFDAWLASIRDRIYAESAARISEHRFEMPIAVRPFVLKSLEGHLVTLDDLEGKLSIVKFWAVWCGPCRMEMPEFADFASRFADDRDVEVLTVNLDPNPESVRRWLVENELELPVLIDDGYSNRVGVTGLPTTWFLDGEGRKVYDVIGAIPDLENEYVMRLETMRDGARN